MSLTATNAQVYKGTAAVTYGSGSGVSNRELQGTASVTYGGAPTSNTALSLPGPTGNYMNINPTAANFDLASNNMFVECWFYSAGAGGGGAGNLQQVAAGGGPTINVDQVWGMYFYFTPNNSINFYLCNNAGGSTTASLSVTLNYSTWYHAAISWVASTKSMYVFLNGTPSGTVKPYSSTYGLYIGADYNRNTCNGYVRDLRVVQGGTVPTTSFTPAQAPFRLNVPSYVTGGTTVLSLYEQYFYPSWLNLPGSTGAYMDFSKVPITRVNTSTTNMFIESWVYFNSLSGVENYIAGVNTVSSQTNDDWGLRYDVGSTKIQFYHYNAGNSAIVLQSTATPLVSTWYHIAVSVVTGNPGTLYLFVNGVLQNAGGTGTTSTPRYTSTSTLWLGSPGNGGWGPSNLYIQDLRIVSGGTVPTATFTPRSAPFGLASPSYVSGGTTVLSLATQYYQTGMTNYTDASGSTITYVNGYKTHTFTTVGTFTFTLKQSISSAQVLVVAGGGAGGAWGGAGGGGAGGLIYVSSLSLPAGSYTVTVGSGGTAPSGSGANSVFSTYTAIGGGGGATNGIGFNGGSGGGSQSPSGVGSGTAGQGNNGGQSPSTGPAYGGGGGGGAGAVGQNGTGTFGGKGGDGLSYSISGSPVYYAGGGGGSYVSGGTDGLGGLGGGGRAVVGGPGIDGTPNTGGGGGASGVVGGTGATRAGAGGSGIVIISYPIGIQFTSRPILPAVLTNPGNQTFSIGGTVTVAQTALEPANGITWTLAPTGQGVSIASSTDYALTLSTPTAVTQNLFTVSARNKAGLTTVTQFTGSTPSLSKVTVAPVAVYSLRGQKSTYTLAFNVRNGTTSATQDFYADTLGNLTTAAGSGQTLTQWLGGATGYITTWYDQSGNGNHASQGTTAYQPVITSALIASNLFGLNFQNSCGLTTSAFTNSLNVTLVMVIVIKSTIATWGNFAHHGHHDYDWSIRQNGLSPTYIHWHTNNDNTGDQLAIIYDTPMVLYCTMTNGTAMSFQMLTSTSSYVTTATESLTLTVGSKIMYIGKSDTGEPCNSYIGEFNYFQSVLSATDQTAILADVCSRWGITNFNPLFNTTSSTVTSAVLSAYSLRDLYGTSPVVVNVRRSSDNSTQDFYADTRGNLTTLSAGAGQTLASWLGGATGYVTTWYDQSGLGNHASQATSGNQPVIQSGTKGPGYMLSFTATQNQYLTGFAYSKLANTKYTVCEVDRRTASISPVTNGSDNAIISCGTTGVTDQCLHLTYRSGTTAYYGQFGDDYSVPVTAFTSASTEPVRFRFHMASSTSGSGRRIYVYGDPLGYVTNFITGNTALLSASGVGNFYIGYYFNGPTYYQGELYETIVFNNSLYDLDNTATQIATIYDSQYDYINTPK